MGSMEDQLTRHTSYLTKRDLENIAKTFRWKYHVTLIESTAGLWTVEIRFEGQNGIYGVETSRGVLKIWRNLSNAIIFVQKSCGYARDVVVDVHGWKLVKINAIEA